MDVCCLGRRCSGSMFCSPNRLDPGPHHGWGYGLISQNRTRLGLDMFLAGPQLLWPCSQSRLEPGRHGGWAMDALLSQNGLDPGGHHGSQWMLCSHRSNWTTDVIMLGRGCSLLRLNKYPCHHDWAMHAREPKPVFRFYYKVFISFRVQASLCWAEPPG